MGLKSLNLWIVESVVAWLLREEMGRRLVAEGRWRRWGKERRQKAAVVDGEYSAILSIIELKIEFRSSLHLYKCEKDGLFGVWRGGNYEDHR